MELLRRAPVILAWMLALTGCAGAEQAHPTPAVESPAPLTGQAPVPSPTPREEEVLEPTPVALDWVAAVVHVPPLPPSFAAARPDPELQEVVHDALEGSQGRTSVVVQHLGEGRSAGVGAGEVYYAASLFKLAVLLAAYRERDAGRLDFQRVLEVDGWYAEQDLGTMEGLGLAPGDRVTVEDAIKAMIVVSDTPTAVLVQDAVGDMRVEGMLREEQLHDTSVLTPELPTTAADMTGLLLAIARGHGVSISAREEMLGLLLQEHIHDGIIAGVPDGIPVAHKTGNYAEATHDVGIVWGRNGPYVLAVLTDRPWEWEAVVRVSRAVYEYFER